MWQEGLVASLLRAGVSLTLRSGRVTAWEERSEEDPKDGNKGSRWLMGWGGDMLDCLPRKAELSRLQAGADSVDL